METRVFLLIGCDFNLGMVRDDRIKFRDAKFNSPRYFKAFQDISGLSGRGIRYDESNFHTLRTFSSQNLI